MSSEAVEIAGQVAAAWSILLPYSLLGLATLAWGRAPLPWAAVRRSLIWSLAGGMAVLLPLMWSCFAYFAGFRLPNGAAARAGGVMALRLLPVYVVFAGVVAFDLRLRRAIQAGLPRRSAPMRALAYLAIGLLLVFGLFVILLGFMGLSGFRME